MIRFILVALLALVMFLPVAQAEEKFECINCSHATWTAFHDSKDLALLLGCQVNGVIMSNGENKFLDSTTYHCEGVVRGLGENMRQFFYCRYIDPDGDILVTEWTATGDVGVGKFLEGTGKYKGIKGNYETPEKITKKRKPAMPGTDQYCRKMTGTYELAK